MDDIFGRERLAACLLEYNQPFELQADTKRKFRVWPLGVEFVLPGGHEFWGRFGGGWQWRLGIDIGRSAHGAVVNLLVGYVRLRWLPKRGESRHCSGDYLAGLGDRVVQLNDPDED